MRGAGGGAGGTEFFTAPGMKGAGGGAGAAEEAFRTPELKGAGGGAGEGSFTVGADKAIRMPGAGSFSRVRGRALRALKASEMRSPLREPNMTGGGEQVGQFSQLQE